MSLDNHSANKSTPEIIECTNNQCALDDAARSGTKYPNANHLSSTPVESPTVHNLTGASIKLQVDNVTIKTSEYHISKFAYLNQLVKEARLAKPQSETLTIVVAGGDKLVSDFLNTFKALNISSIEPPRKTDLETLVSVARISAKYGHPTLHEVCIQRLKGLSLNPMERIQVARALNLRSWEEAAYQDLSKRVEMITKEEALILGIGAYWRVATARETQQKTNHRAFDHSESNGSPKITHPNGIPQTNLVNEEEYEYGLIWLTVISILLFIAFICFAGLNPVEK